MKAFIALTVLFALLVGNEGVTVAEKEEIVNKHNELRRGVQPTASNMLKMEWNDEAADNAQEHANKCTNKHSQPMERKINSNTRHCGENMFMSRSEYPWSTAVQEWYDEVENFEHGVGSVNGKTVGHFTQVVWYNSYQVGCAMAHCPNADSVYKYYYVCQYCPSGNFVGQMPYKLGVLGLSCGDCPDACDNKLCTNPCNHLDKWSNCADYIWWFCNPNREAECMATCKCTSGEII